MHWCVGRLRGSVPILVLLLVFCGAGCTLRDDEPAAQPGPDADTVSALQEALARRDRAVRRADERAFLAGVRATDAALVRRQRRYFANLEQLPLAAYRHTLLPDSLTPEPGGGVRVEVRVAMQLRGYDEVPVAEVRRLRFRPDPDATGRWLLSSERDLDWEREHHVGGQPWDLTGTVVRERSGVLGVFDEGSAGRAATILAAVDAARSEVARVMPHDWSGRVVVYALSSTRVLARLRGLPGGDPERLDAVAFPVHGRRAGQVAAYRFMLHPRMLARPGPARDRLIRHELTHVALGERDDGVPTWLAEGLAEYVSAQPLPERERTISRAALDTARRGIRSLPDDDTFNGVRSGANYGVSWWVCQQIADTYGQDMLWTLLETYADTEPGEQDAVLPDLLGVQERDLARRAGERIVATFG